MGRTGELLGIEKDGKLKIILDGWEVINCYYVKPYLKKMTNQDKEVLGGMNLSEAIRYIGEKHLDLEGWIEEGKALEAPEGMYD